MPRSRIIRVRMSREIYTGKQMMTWIRLHGFKYNKIKLTPKTVDFIQQTGPTEKEHTYAAIAKGIQFILEF